MRVTQRIFVTGASGLLGEALLERLRGDAVEKVRALSRADRTGDDRVEWVRGDLAELGAWAPRLEGCDALLHLGASTGRASAAEHARINHDATRSLVRAAR